MRHAIVFARRPRLGTVKTRLAAEIGPVETLRFYRANLFRLARDLGADRRWATWIAATPDDAAGDRRTWPDRVGLFAQGEGDLGDRMRFALARFGHQPALIVGSDIPAAGRRQIGAAFDSLRSHDLVFGPAADGGYWLVGAAQSIRVGGLFEDVRWSTPDALSDTLENVRPGVRVAMLETLDDVDTAEAYYAWRSGS